MNVMVCGPIGVTELEGAESSPKPAMFLAFTVNVYAVPLVKPARVIGEAELVFVKLPGFEVMR